MTPRAPEQLPAEYRRPRPQLERNASTQSKLSLPTSSQSNEADDEQSFSDGSYMESNATDPQYEGEDTRLTSDKELSGFYMYGWAAEVCSRFPSSTSVPSLREEA
jgi:UMF1 family MFS transporter